MQTIVHDLLHSIDKNEGVSENLKRFNEKKEFWNTEEIAVLFEKGLNTFSDEDSKEIIKKIIALSAVESESQILEIVASSEAIYERISGIALEEHKKEWNVTLQQIEPTVMQVLQDLQKNIVQEENFKNINEALSKIDYKQLNEFFTEKLNTFEEKDQLRIIKNLIKKYRNDTKLYDGVLRSIYDPTTGDQSLLQKALTHVKF